MLNTTSTVRRRVEDGQEYIWVEEQGDIRGHWQAVSQVRNIKVFPPGGALSIWQVVVVGVISGKNYLHSFEDESSIGEQKAFSLANSRLKFLSQE